MEDTKLNNWQWIKTIGIDISKLQTTLDAIDILWSLLPFNGTLDSVEKANRAKDKIIIRNIQDILRDMNVLKDYFKNLNNGGV
ncbi:MAG: hypothetical protein COS89_06945 [Deltaproteobacteria bacterium CG07_land_8_20_14_0_80_38_7]|nr:MAG: hypothetical protein COS89_06945 [Deltaproteobacteria bacterium CG07_land_8_20_14_0_80_38_7]